MRPKELILTWVKLFNAKDASGLQDLYAVDAVNHQVNAEPVIGNAPIGQMFAREFEQFDMVCNVENIFEDGEWAILEWKDPLGLRGCGFFHIQQDKIIFQRGYWDRLSFLQQHGLPFPTE